MDALCSLARSIAFLDDSGNLVLSSLATFFAFCSCCSFIWPQAGLKSIQRSSHCFLSLFFCTFLRLISVTVRPMPNNISFQV